MGSDRWKSAEMGFFDMGITSLQKEKYKGLSGRSTLRVWQRDVIPGLMAYGYDLAAAMKRARLIGAMVLEDIVDNLIVYNGLYLTGQLLCGEETTGITYHAIGTSNTAPANGDTDLTVEVSRKPFAVRETSSYNQVDFSAFYKASESTYSILECGVFGGATATSSSGTGTLFSHYLSTYNNSGGNYDLTYSYVVTIS